MEEHFSLYRRLLLWILYLTRCCLYPSFYTFNALTSLFKVTFQEENQVVKIFLRKLFLGPLFGILFLWTLPLFIFFLPIRCFLLILRNKIPFVLSVKYTNYTEQQTKLQNEFIDESNYKFGVATSNLCLLAEVLSRENHLTNVDSRSEKIGKQFVKSQLYNSEWTRKVMQRNMTTQADVRKSESEQNGRKSTKGNLEEQTTNNSSKRSRLTKKSTVEGDVAAEFSRLDFLLIQEAWSSYHNGALINELHKVFPYIVHDVSTHTMSTNRFCLTSGLLFASRHPILALDFKPFENFILHGKFLCSGLLCAKVNGRLYGFEKSLGSFIFHQPEDD